MISQLSHARVNLIARSSISGPKLLIPGDYVLTKPFSPRNQRPYSSSTLHLQQGIVRQWTAKSIRSLKSQGLQQTNHCRCSGIRDTFGKRWIATSDRSDGNKYFSKMVRPHRNWNTQTVEVSVGGNGSVLLEITSFSDNEDVFNTSPKPRDILVYLHPGLTLYAAKTAAAEEQHLQHISGEHRSLLENLTVSGRGGQSIPTVVKINYRLSPLTGHNSTATDHRFPTPIHDVSVAFDWIIANALELTSASTEYSPEHTVEIEIEQPEPRISIYGSHIGGSLALMLALTLPNELHTVAVRDPVVDWVGLDELAATTWSVPSTSSKRRVRSDVENTRLQMREAVLSLIDIRTRLFRTPSAFFDPFASPLMFLRAPGRDTPLWRTAKPGIEGETEMVEAMKREGGVEVSEAETHEAVNERGYGPYDDDWHTVEPNHQRDKSSVSTTTQQNADIEQVVSDLSALSVSGQSHQPSPQMETNLSRPAVLAPIPDHSSHQFDYAPTRSELQQDTSPSTRRRKVLRRWPPVGRPEDVDLPWTRIFTTPPASASAGSTEPDSALPDLAYVLHPQAKDLADVMKRACFWGREKWFAEEKVGLETVEHESGDEEREVVKRVVGWLSEMRKSDG